MKKNTRIKHRKYNTRKKYIFPLVCLSLLLGVSMVGVFAEKGDVFVGPNGLEYTVYKEVATTSPGSVGVELGTAYISGYETEPEGILTIPDEVTRTTTDAESGTATTYTYKVVSIGDPDGTTTDGPFKGCKKITGIDFTNASNLTMIGQRAFQDCTELTELNLEGADNLTTIHKRAFMGCTALENANLAGASQLSEIKNSAFSGCYNLETVEFSSNKALTKIGNSAFSGCTWLTKITNLADNTVVAIASGENAAFYGCCYLKADQLPSSEENNPDPFNASSIVKLTTESRGISKLGNIIAANGYDGTEDIPSDIKIFKGQDYLIDITPSDGYELVGLQFLKDASEASTASYTIDTKYFTNSNENTHTFNLKDWSENSAVLFAVATGKASSGAPTITTDKLPDGARGTAYSTEVTATSSIANGTYTWTVVPGKGNLPPGLTLTSDGTATAVISGIPTTSSSKPYTFVLQASNDVSYHQKEFSISIYDSSLQAVKNLQWKALQTGTMFAIWDPLENPSGETITYSVQLYKDGSPVEEPKTVNLMNSSTGDPSSFPQVNFMDYITKHGKGVYTFTVTASGADSGSAISEMSEEYLHDIKTYTITAVAGANGAISLDETSRTNLPLDIITEEANNITLKVREGAVTADTPLTFHITPNEGYEAETVTMNGNATKNKSLYSFTSFDENVTEYALDAQFDLISNRIDGIQDGASYTQGAVASFEAIGEDIGAAGGTGDTRWLPVSWELSGDTMSHTWKSDPYTDDIDTADLEPGDYTLYVTFQKQAYDVTTSKWNDVVDAVEVKSVSFEVKSLLPTGDSDTDGDKNTNGSDSDKSDKDSDSDNTTGSEVSTNGSGSGSSGSSGSGGSGSGSALDSLLSTVRTGDDMQVALWGALALLSLIGIGYCLVRLIKFGH